MRALDEDNYQKIIRHLKDAPRGLTIAEISRATNLSRITAAKYLNSLFISGQLNMRKAGPAKVYSLSARLPADQVLSKSQDPVLILDESYTIREASKSFLQAFGIENKNLTGRDVFRTAIGPGFIERIREPLKRALAGEESMTDTWIPVRKEWKAFRIRIVPLVFSWGAKGVVVRLEDQTGEIMAREENFFLADLLNDSPAAITVLDFEGNHLYSNRMNLEIHGYSAAEFLRLNIREIDCPESKKKVASRMKKLKDKGDLTFEVIHFHKDGHQIPLEVHAKVVTWGTRDVIVCIATDITERIRADAEIRESEETFRALVEQSVEGIVIVDFSGNVRFSNRRALDIVECPAELRMTETFNVYDVISRDFQENALCDLHQVSRGIDGYEVFYKILTLEQHEKWVACIGKKITFRGAPAILISFRDVTERKQEEDALRESEHKFSTLFTTNPVPLTLVSAESGVFVDVNESFLHDTGFLREEVVGRTAEELGLFASPKAYADMVARLRDKKELQTWEMECRVKSGIVRTCLFSSRIILMGGRPHIISTIEDISERKAAESAFQTMVSSMIGTSEGASLDRITENLAGWLKADCVMIGEIMPNREQVEVLSMVLDGKKIRNFSYSLEGTPCENAAEKGFCVFTDDVATIFPGSRDLQRFGIRGYAGTPLRNAEGIPVGIICIMSREPLVLPPSAREIIDIIAVKAAAEIGFRNTRDGRNQMRGRQRISVNRG